MVGEDDAILISLVLESAFPKTTEQPRTAPHDMPRQSQVRYRGTETMLSDAYHTYSLLHTTQSLHFDLPVSILGPSVDKHYKFLSATCATI